MNERKQLALGGVICIILGASLVMIALRILPYDESKIFAPDWVIILGGGIFIFGGLAMAFQHRPVFLSLLGNLIVLSFALIGIWIALRGPSAQFSGGIPFLPHELNVRFARILFGTGALMCFLILIPGIRHLLKLSRPDS
jgi:hypothetical protein